VSSPGIASLFLPLADINVLLSSYVIYAILFEDVYHFSQYQAGLTFAPLLIGGLIAIPVMGVFDRLTYQKARAEAIRSGTEVHPEKRLYPAMLSVILLPISLFVRHLIFPSSLIRMIFLLFAIYVLNQVLIKSYLHRTSGSHGLDALQSTGSFQRFQAFYSA
jgi:hypothetical protein